MKHILVTRLSALGDICMTLPVLDSVCRKYPDLRLTLVTSGAGATIAKTVLADLPNFAVKGINAHRDYAGIGGLNRLYNELRVLDCDAMADLHDVLRTKWLRLRFALSGRTTAHIDKGRAEKKALVAHSHHKALKNSIDRYAEVFARLGLPVEVRYDGAAHGAALRPQVGPSLDAARPLAIGIAPFAQHQGKVYPPQQMQKVIEILTLRMPNMRIYLLGGPNEQETLQTWAAPYPQVSVLAGKQSLADDLRSMAQMRLLVSMDSANMHMASLVGLRCVSIWGATHPNAGFLGYGQRLDDVISLPLECRPCSVYGNKSCRFGHWNCLTQLSPQAVADAILLRL